MNENLKETLVMVADYTEEEKTKLLNKVRVSGLVSTLCFIFLLIMYVFNMYSKSDAMDSMFVYLMYIGIAFSMSALFSGMQLSGKVNKEKFKKAVKILLPICIALTVVFTVLLLILIAV